MDKIRVKWSVEDGYAGKDRPRIVHFDIDDFEGCETEDKVGVRLDEMMEEEFRYRITWHVNNRDEAIAAVMKALTDGDTR